MAQQRDGRALYNVGVQRRATFGADVAQQRDGDDDGDGGPGGCSRGTETRWKGVDESDWIETEASPGKKNSPSHSANGQHDGDEPI